MAFVTDKSELKPGLVLFRRGDVDHRMRYCRMKIPKADRYKTVSLKTTDIDIARERAFDQDADIRFRLKHDVPVFNDREVGREYLLTQEARAKRGEISAARPKKTVTYNMILIACNTGMRPIEMKNLRWRDIMSAKDREGREIAVLFVQGKDKTRKLVAPKSVGEYLERIRVISRATEPDDRVFSTTAGKPAKSLYTSLIADLLDQTNLREGTQGVPSIHMIEQHYGHVNTIKHADRVLQGMAGWELPQSEPDDTTAKASKTAASHDQAKGGQRNKPR